MTHPAPAAHGVNPPAAPPEPDGPGEPGGQGAQWLRLLPAVLDDDPDEAAVTDALLDTVDLAGDLQPLVEALADLLEHASAPGTRRAYATDWAEFADWTGRHALAALPAEPRTVALYVTAQQDRLRPATLLRRLSAIAVAHRTAGRPSPTGHELVRRAVAGLRRKHGARPAGKTALVTAPLIAICHRLHDRETAAAHLAADVDALAGGPGAAAERRRAAGALRAARAAALRARRDRTLLLVGYAAALRRSELVALDLADLAESEHGLQVFVARSKTDQAALGDFVGIVHGHPAGSCTVTGPARPGPARPDPARSGPGRTGGTLSALSSRPWASSCIPPPRRSGRSPGTARWVPPDSSIRTHGSPASPSPRLSRPPLRCSPTPPGTRPSGTPGTACAPASPPRPPPPASRWTGSCARPGTAASPSHCATSAPARSGTTTPAPPSACLRSAKHSDACCRPLTRPRRMSPSRPGRPAAASAVPVGRSASGKHCYHCLSKARRRSVAQGDRFTSSDVGRAPRRPSQRRGGAPTEGPGSSAHSTVPLAASADDF